MLSFGDFIVRLGDDVQRSHSGHGSASGALFDSVRYEVCFVSLFFLSQSLQYNYRYSRLHLVLALEQRLSPSSLQVHSSRSLSSFVCHGCPCFLSGDTESDDDDEAHTAVPAAPVAAHWPVPPPPRAVGPSYGVVRSSFRAACFWAPVFFIVSLVFC